MISPTNTIEQNVDDLTALLEVAKKNLYQQEEAKRKRRSEARTAFFTTHPYIYTVTMPEPYRIGTHDVETVDIAYVSRKVDSGKYIAFTRNRPADEQDILHSDDLARNAGMQYYLTTDGIIHHTGGGTVVLKTPQLCSPAQWKCLKSGHIPVEFLRGGE